MKTLPQRITEKISVKESGCWEWVGCIRPDKYGQVKLNGKLMLAHRAVYELLIGPIPNGLTLDHLCRNRSCCNPDHLEPVPVRINIQRGVPMRIKTPNCPQGHPYTFDNTGVSELKTGYLVRYCRTCKREKRRKRVEILLQKHP